MKEILDFGLWYEAVLSFLQRAGETLEVFLPRLLLALLVLGIGWIAARVVQAVARRVLHRAGLDRLAASSRIAEALGKAGVESAVSALVARLLFWGLLLTVGLFALQTLGIEAVVATLEKVIAFLPNVFAAVVIIVAGVPLGRLVRNFVTSGAAAAGLGQAARLGTAAQVVVSLVIGVLALSQLGIDTDLLITVITTLVATIGLSMGLAFALGARPLVTHILAGHFLRQNLARGTTVEVLGKSGEVQSVGAVTTVLSNGEQEWLVPNEKLVNEVLER